MASSDDEAEVGPLSVSNYHFVDDEEEPISFSLLPFQWSDSECDGEKNKRQIFLHGSVDNGLRTIHKEVIAWKFDLSNANPDIFVLTKEKSCIRLQKPRKSFGEIIRSELITVQCLHYARLYPEASSKSVWDYLAKIFSLYNLKPSQNDLVDHMALISEAIKRDVSLAKSEFLHTFLEEKPEEKKLSNEAIQTTIMSGFIVDDVDDDIIEDLEEDESNGDELFDFVCAFCDNGGELLCCDGSCMRSFHATKEAGEESMCESLGFTEAEVETIERFYCKNCEYKRHQCFACGELGSSDKSVGAEVFRCANATCGYFFHPRCVAKLIHQDDEVAAEELQTKIAAGKESFICPIHKCCVCKQGENKKIKELQFAVCRRCPTSYHRKCLPREIVFEKKKEEEEGEEEEEEEEEHEIRAWDDLLPNRVLIYCLKHDMIDDLGTPIRDVRFPEVEKNKKKQASDLPETSDKLLPKKRKLISEDSNRRLASEDSVSGDAVVKKVKEPSSGAKRVANIRKSEKISSGSNVSRKVKEKDPSKRSENMKSSSAEVDRPATSSAKKATLGEKLFELMNKRSARSCPEKQDMHAAETDKKTDKTSAMKLNSEIPSLDADTERRLLALMKESSSSITMECVRKKHQVPSTHAYSLKGTVDKTITAGKVEGAVEAVKTALKKLEDGCSIEDAKAVCEPEILNQVFKWKNKLRVYLAPFLNGMRYTSFGRHFTKVEKLQEIVNMLHWYVEDGDMIVDFCCGANDFSCLMKKKLEQTGKKKCSYKNYDVIQPKNDFNFEKRDWMTVRLNELRKKGSQLIMGINPPFGVKSALANKFINKALEFKPKLLILIVPPETERLDKKDPPYYLVWEDDQFVSGRSFYLPGSVDENDRQVDQWNLTAPPLSLWSHPDWHEKHLAIAQKQGHLDRQRGGSPVREGFEEAQTFDQELHVHPATGDALKLSDLHVQNKEPNSYRRLAEASKEGSTRDNAERESQDSHGPERSHSKETLGKRTRDQSKAGRVASENFPENSQNGGKSAMGDKYKETLRCSSPKAVNSKSSQEGSTSRYFDASPRAEVGEHSFPNTESGVIISHVPYGTAPHGNMAGNHDSVSERYGANNKEHSRRVCGFSHSNFDDQTAGLRKSSEDMGYISYITEHRELDLRPQIRHYDQDADLFARRSYMGNHDPGCGRLGPLPSYDYGAPVDSYRTNMSVMERYAPRLDELNHSVMGNYGPSPSPMNRNDMYHPRPPQPPPGYHVDSISFASGPHHPYARHNSAGWLNE